MSGGGLPGGAGVVSLLAARAMELRARQLEPAAEHAARRAFADWLGAALSGSASIPAAALLAGLETGGGSSRIIGREITSPAPLAALINGTSAHAMELDDIYAPGLFHPGAPVIAAALAAADLADASAAALWRAIITGYEIGCRVAADLGPGHYQHWHTTGTAGAVGAAAAVAEIRQADPRQFAHALALAATMAGGLQQTFRSDAMGKPLHAGAAAQAGVIAAAAAMGGVSGAPDVLEGPAGLAAATGTVTDWRHCRAELGRPLAVETVTIKPYPCCGHAFAVIDAALELRARGVRAGDVVRLEVQTYSAALAVAGIAQPRTEAERRFSIPFLTAAALTVGNAGLTGNQAADTPDVRRLAGDVILRAGAEFEERFPARRGARVAARLYDGSIQEADVPDRSGSPENPLTPARFREKFLAVCAPAADRGPAMLDQLLGPLDPGPVRAIDLGTCR